MLRHRERQTWAMKAAVGLRCIVGVFSAAVRGLRAVSVQQEGPIVSLTDLNSTRRVSGGKRGKDRGTYLSIIDKRSVWRLIFFFFLSCLGCFNDS